MADHAQNAHPQDEDAGEGEEDDDRDIEQGGEPVAQRGFVATDRRGALEKRAAPLRLLLREIAPRAPCDEQREEQKRDAKKLEDGETHRTSEQV